jgi:uncharacterized membrane protein/mono/diheme cytochrome c family protein
MMFILSVTDFIARLHPVLVHLPIGILIMACLFQWLSISNRYVFLQPAVPVALFWGMLGAAISCITGYLLSQSGDYDQLLTSRHQWFGIAVAIFSLVLYLLHKLSVGEILARWLSLVLVILISITGHLGGTLTHGEGYLTAGLGSGSNDKASIKPIANVQEAVAYEEIVQPILQSKCYSCHGATKQKGKLRLDNEELIMKGGEDGKVLIAGKADESELIKRIFLPIGDEDHMPPKAKPQLTETEVLLLHWWVNSGADFKKKVNELEQPEKMKPVLASLQTGGKEAQSLTDVPAEPVEKADDIVVNKLRQAGVVVVPVAQNSNYLMANFVTTYSTHDSIMQLLSTLKKQLIWLKLSNRAIGDSAMPFVAACSSLTRLYLNHTTITDKGLEKLSTLNQLQLLNLVGTKVTADGILRLKGLSGLRQLFLYHTEVKSNNWLELQKAFPAVKLDSGKYEVPTLATDTTEIKF